MENIKNINEKLMKIQNELKATKDKYNNFGKYAYRSCEGILESLKPLLLENRVALIIEDEVCVCGDRIYIKSTAILKDVDSEKEIKVSAFAREEESKKGMDSMQLTGATSSYSRKYALNGLFCIDDNQDSDSTNKQRKEEIAPKKETEISETEKVKKVVAAILKISSEKGLSADEMELLKKSSVELIKIYNSIK